MVDLVEVIRLIWELEEMGWSVLYENDMRCESLLIAIINRLHDGATHYAQSTVHVYTALCTE